MNLTLLEKLYTQSFITVPHKPTSGFDARWEDTIFVPEKFAELIVQECVEQVLTGVRTSPPQPEPPELVQILVRRIQRHFGVE